MLFEILIDDMRRSEGTQSQRHVHINRYYGKDGIDAIASAGHTRLALLILKLFRNIASKIIAIGAWHALQWTLQRPLSTTVVS